MRCLEWADHSKLTLPNRIIYNFSTRRFAATIFLLARPGNSFRPDQGLFLLATRVRLDPNGQPHIPGNYDVWKEVLRVKSDSKIMREWAKRGMKQSDQFMQGMFALSRVTSSQGPLHIS